MPRDTKKNKPADYIQEHTVAFTHHWVPAGTRCHGFDDDGNYSFNKRGYWERVCVYEFRSKAIDPQTYMKTRFKNQQPPEVSQ